MRRIITSILASALSISLLAGCTFPGGKSQSGSSETTEQSSMTSSTEAGTETGTETGMTQETGGTDTSAAEDTTGGGGTEQAVPDFATAADIDSYYKDLKESWTKESGKTGEQLDQMMKNIDTLYTYNKKAMDYCGDNYLVVNSITSDSRGPMKIKIYFSKGSYRTEEYHDDKVAYVEVYNKEQNKYQTLDVASGNLQEMTNAAEKGYLRNDLQFGYFPVFNLNAVDSTMKEDTLDGKKVLYCEVSDGVSNKIWIDAETGIMIKGQELDNGKAIYQEAPVVKKDVTLDPSLFELNKDQPDAGKDIN